MTFEQGENFPHFHAPPLPTLIGLASSSYVTGWHDVLLYHASVGLAIDLLSVLERTISKLCKQYLSPLITHQLTELLQQSPVTSSQKTGQLQSHFPGVQRTR